jgi:hypothetical protein
VTIGDSLLKHLQEREDFCQLAFPDALSLPAALTRSMRRAAIRTTSVSTGALSISISAGRRRPSSTILIFFAEYLLSYRPADVLHNLQLAS